MNATASSQRTRPEARWILPSAEESLVRNFEEELGLQPLTANILAQRGFKSAAEVGLFLRPPLSALHDPMRMTDMAVAADRLWMAVQNREPILLYGDYDVDGTTSIVILKKALDLLGAQVRFHVPHRLKDGYGMRPEVIERAATEGVRLIVSVDTGIRATEVVRQARALGIDVIVTDHHLPEAELPPALAVLNPNRRDCGYPEKHLCGAGVALKLIQALLERSGLPSERQARLLDSFLKLVSIATIADIVPLTGENRIIVRRGLEGLRSVRNAGLKALIGVSGLMDGIAPSAHQIAFRVAPRINAAGRMASASDVIDLFLTEDANRAGALATQLDDLNRERQQAEAEIVEQILKKCEQTFSEDAYALVFADSGWHLGVVGIVASRLVERFCRPVFVLSDGNDAGHFAGSGRSIPDFHLLDALESMPHLFKKFGGHRQAAGLTIRCEYVEDFRRELNEYARGLLTPDAFRPRFVIDAEANFAELHEGTVNEVFSLAPFGFGNPAPLLCTRGVEVAGPPRMIKEGKHLKVPLRQGNRLLFFKAWNFGDRIHLFEPGKKIDVLFSLEDDPGAKSRGYGSWSPSLKDARITGSDS